MAASDAKPIPRKNVAHRVYFPIYDADGDPVTSATGLLGLVSVDGAAAVTTTSAPTEIGAIGVFIQDLTAAEMNGDGIVLKVTSSSAGAKAAIIVLYPQENEDIKVSVTHWGSSPVASVGVAGIPKVDVTHWISVAAATPTVGGVPEVDLTHVAGSTTNVSALATNVDAILTDTTEIGVAGAGLTNINLPNQTMDITGNITGNLSGSVGSVTGAVGSVTAKVSANVIEWLSSPLVSVGVAGVPKVDVTHWISSAVATPTVAGVPEVDLTHVAGATTDVSTLATSVAAILVDTGTTLDGLITTVDTVVDAIKVQTDKMTFTVANQIDANMQYINDTALTGNGGVTPWGPV